MSDLVVISLGAGVQSTALYLMSANGILPRADLAIFADTQDEPARVYDHLDRLRDRYGHTIPIEVVTAGKLSDEILRSIRETPSQFIPIPVYAPNDRGRESQGRRQCTRSHKLDPIQREIRRRIGKGGVAEMWLGISTDEAHRAKPSRYPHIRHRFPLLFDKAMRRADCAAYLESVGWTVAKSSCVYCPYRSDRQWAEMRSDDPESFTRAVAVERAILDLKPGNYLHSSCAPLDAADFDADRDQLELFGNECEGMCGV